MLNETLSTLLARRSIRSFEDRPLSRETLEAILEAGRYAPSGGNSQLCHFTVILSRPTLDRLNQIATTSFAAMEETPGMYKSMANAIRRARTGPVDYWYGAPVLVVVSNRKSHPNAMADSACAIENMMVAATSLGIGSCWINQIKWLSDDPAMRICLEELGITGEECICGSVALGIPAQTPGAPLARTGNPVTWIE